MINREYVFVYQLFQVPDTWHTLLLLILVFRGFFLVFLLHGVGWGVNLRKIAITGSVLRFQINYLLKTYHLRSPLRILLQHDHHLNHFCCSPIIYHTYLKHPLSHSDSPRFSNNSYSHLTVTNFK